MKKASQSFKSYRSSGKLIKTETNWSNFPRGEIKYELNEILIQFSAISNYKIFWWQ